MLRLRVGTALTNFIALSVLFAVFGGSLFSLSVDVAHHYAVIDAIIKNGSANATYLGYMSRYPALSYWISAGVGHLIGSGLVAMWLLSITAIYATYYFLFRLLSNDRNIFPLVLFLCLVPVVARSEAIFGFEVIVNFFYPQLIGSAIYCGFLLYIAQQEQPATLQNVLVTLILACITMSVHGLPAFEILGTFGIILLLSVLRKYLSARLDKIDSLKLILFTVGCLALLKFHPAFAALREFSKNDGGIELAIRWTYLVPLALCAIGLLLSDMFASEKDWSINRTSLVLLSATTAAIFLMAMQFALLMTLHEGSAYAIRKHSYFVFTMSVFACFHLASCRIQPHVNRYIKGQSLLPIKVVVATCATIMTSAIFWERPAWLSQGFDLYQMAHQIRYAENAIATSHPHFKPGNTAVIAPNIHATVRYMISTTTFQMEVSAMPAIAIVFNKFDPKKSVEYVMVESSSESNKSCSTRYAETSEFSIIPVACLK